jgi:hypothetical protein
MLRAIFNEAVRKMEQSDLYRSSGRFFATRICGPQIFDSIEDSDCGILVF